VVWVVIVVAGVVVAVAIVCVFVDSVLPPQAIRSRNDIKRNGQRVTDALIVIIPL
jgi:hypothetical protein